MIAFGVSVTEPEVYERCAEPGLRLVAEPDSEILAHGSSGSVFRSYNMLMDRAKKLEDLEALVLIHQDAEIIDPDFLKKIREALSRSGRRDRRLRRRDRRAQHRLVGRLGDLGVIHPPLRGAGRRRGPRARLDARRRRPPTRRPARSRPSTASSSGSRRGRSASCASTSRFGQAIHGYDFDLCLQAREKGKKVVTADLKVVHHHDLKLIRDVGNWIEAHIKVAEKWDGRMPLVGKEGDPEDWKARARRAEAQASAERMIAAVRPPLPRRPDRPAHAPARADGGGSRRACGRPRTGLPPSSRPSAPTSRRRRGAPAQADQGAPAHHRRLRAAAPLRRPLPAGSSKSP